MNRVKWVIRLAYFQGIFYLIIGLWPIVDIGTFEIATGPKIDLWLVRTVGALVTCTGLMMLMAARSREITRPLAMLAVTNAVALTMVDIVYVSLNVIPKIYLGDAIVESAIVVSWLMLWPASLKNQFRDSPLNRFDREGELSNILR